jgi:hypothetical protein
MTASRGYEEYADIFVGFWKHYFTCISWLAAKHRRRGEVLVWPKWRKGICSEGRKAINSNESAISRAEDLYLCSGNSHC